MPHWFSLLAAFVVGFGTHWAIGQANQVEPVQIRHHWNAVHSWHSAMSLPQNQVSVDGLSGVRIEKDIEPHLNELVRLSELRFADLVLPNVRPSQESTRLWQRFCGEHSATIVYSTANPSYAALTIRGDQPFHMKIWYREAGTSEIQQLIHELEAAKENE